MKKMLSMILAVVLALGLAGTAGAASLGKITDITEPISSKDFEDITVSPGKVYELPLTADMFEWSEGTGGAKDPVSESQLSSANVSVKAKYSGKSKDYVTVELASKKFPETNNAKTAYVKVTFSDKVAGTKEVEFDFTVYLAMKSAKKSDSEISFSGSIIRDIIDVEEDEEYVDLSGGEMAVSDSYIRSMEFYIGDGVSIQYRMYEDKEYYGTCEEGILSSDEKIITTYPEIDMIYRLNTNITAGTVIFDLDDKYYVYNADGKYVGTTADELKYSDTYYLASKKINLSSSNDDDDDDYDDDYDDDDYDDDDDYYYDDDEEATPVETSKSSSTYYKSGNINDNPGTGTKGVAGALTIAAMSGLALIFINRRKES